MIAQALFAVLAGAASPLELTFVASAITTSGANITIPATAQIGDVAVLVDRASTNLSAPASVTPTGWTAVNNLTNTGTSQPRQNLSMKTLVSGDPGLAITGMNGGNNNSKLMLVFRPSKPATFAAQDVAGQATTAAPTNQTVNASSSVKTLIVFAAYGSGSAQSVSTKSFSPSADAEIASGTALYLAYKIYNSNPADVTVSMVDSGNSNLMQSFYVEATE